MLPYVLRNDQGCGVGGVACFQLVSGVCLKTAGVGSQSRLFKTAGVGSQSRFFFFKLHESEHFLQLPTPFI